MSLRLRKQSRQRAEILETSVELFRDRGIGAVRIADIVARCEISEATFFNYFGNKDMLLGEWASDLLDAELEHVAREMEQGGTLRRELRAGLKNLAIQVQSDQPLHKAAWSRLRAAHPDPVLMAARGRSNRRDPALALVLLSQEQGECRADLPGEQLAGLLRTALVATLVSGLEHSELDRRGFLELRLVRACDLILDGFRKRNERIKPSAAPA